MSWKESALLELNHLESSLRERKNEIEIGVENLEGKKKVRDHERKEILLLEMKHLLSRLNDVDKKVTTNLKADAFDKLRDIGKVTERIVNMRKSFDGLNNGKTDEWKVKIQSIKSDIRKLGIEEFSKCLDISVSQATGAMNFAFEKAADAVHLKTPNLNPKKFCMEAVLSTSCVEVKIYLLNDDSPSILNSHVLLQKMNISMMSYLPEGGIRTVEESSIQLKMEKKAAVVSEDERCITVKMKRPSIMFGHISVHLLSSNIVNSPLHIKFPETPAHANNDNLTIVNDDTIGMLDLTGLDQSDINSLDLTARRKHHMTVPRSPRVHRSRNIPKVPEAVAVPMMLTNTLPFSPASEGRVSTMRTAVAVNNLANIHDGNVPHIGKMIIDDNNDHVDETNISVVAQAPSESSAKTMEDIQRSLSGSEVGDDNSMVQLDRSVRFADNAGVVSDHSDDSTKQTRAGDVQDETESIGERDDVNCEVWDTTDLATNNVEVDEENPVGQPVLEESCWRPLSMRHEGGLRPGLHQPPTAWVNWADSVWESTEDDLDDEYNDNPHLLLNASKAPESGADWPSVDPAWDGNTSLLPQPCLDKSLRAYSSQDNNQTIWESDSYDSPGSNYDISVSSLVLEEVFKSQPISSSSSRGTVHCLVSPHSIAFLPTINYFIVTEPELNRVGLYQGDSFKFECWLRYPGHFSSDRQYFTFPTSIISLSNGCIALMERNKFHVFDQHVRPIHAVSGTFHGLTEGPNLQILTLSKNKEGQNVIKRFAKTKYRYKYAGMILIRAVKDFDNWQKLSSLSYLCYNQGKVFMTDKGLHKIFIVDLTTGKQTVKGYLGDEPGQFKKPTGIVVDDVGNLLVGDSGNNRLGVYTDEGKFVKVVESEAWHSLSPRGLVRVDDLVYVALKGEKEGAIAMYKLEESE